MGNEGKLPGGLRLWFVVHFFLDMLFGLPLLFVPEWFMPLFGWSTVDPVTSRLVGAALIGIGGVSLLERNASISAFRAMLNLKVIWASSAVLGLALGIAAGGPPAAWLFLVIFALFLGLWSYYRIRIG